MILVDTSVWVDHLRQGDPDLTEALNAGRAHIHPWVTGELACGNLRARSEILGLLESLPAFTVTSGEEVLFFIERHQLMGRGIGFVDVQLLASTALSGLGKLWTRDKRLHAVASTLGLAHVEAKH